MMNRVEVSSATPRAPSVTVAPAESVSPVSEFHQTVLLDEAVEALAIRPDGCYIDATFGRGGHSRLILSRLSEAGHLLAFDKDLDAIAEAAQVGKGTLFRRFGDRSALVRAVIEPARTPSKPTPPSMPRRPSTTRHRPYHTT